AIVVRRLWFPKKLNFMTECKVCLALNSFGNNNQSARRFCANKPCVKPRRHTRHLDVSDEWQVKRRVISGGQILEVDDTSPSHAVAPASPARADASAQPTLTGIADGTTDLPPQIEEVIDDWMRTWSEKNPTLQLPGNISKIIMDFVQFVTPPSMVEMDVAIKALQTAQERLDELKDLDYMDRETLFQRTTAASAAVSEAKSLVATAQLHYNQSVSACVVAQPDAFQLALDIQDAVGSSCATIGQPVPCLHSPDRTEPSIHIVNGQRRLPCDPKPTTLNVQGYVEEIKQSWPLQMSSRAKLGEKNLSQLDKKRRIVNHEQDVAAFFRSEIVSKIRHVISSRRPDVLFEAMEGYPTSHADMFL
ncbi:hypothetical protein H4S03_008227, partial [Coemansia sp. S3946]